jgi:hypothetical protein
MRFSVIRIMANVVVVFMVLGYPVIGQAKKCGKSINPQPPLTTAVCVLMGSPKAEIRAAKQQALPNLTNQAKQNPLVNCVVPCT